MYRAGIIGCGRIGSEFDDDPKRTTIATHAGAYSFLDNVELVAVADLDTEKLEKCSAKWNVPATYTDYVEMLEKENLDILSVCTWNTTHLAMVEKAVGAGVKAVFCEKPIADTIGHAKRMIELCDQSGVVLQIDHQRRFCELHQRIREFIQNDGMGRIKQASFYYTAGIANTGSHMFDILNFFFGDAAWIQAFESENRSPLAHDPNYDGTIKFKSGLTCTIQACDVKDFVIFELDIIGTKGRTKLLHSGYELEYHEVKESPYFSGYKEPIKGQPPFDTSASRDFMVNAVKHLIDCMENNKKSISSGEEALKALEMICAAHESAKRDGQRINLPLIDSDIVIKSR